MEKKEILPKMSSVQHARQHVANASLSDIMAVCAKTRTTNEKKKGVTNRVNTIERDAEHAYTVSLKGDGDEASVNITVDGVTIPDMLIDSGTTCNIISQKMWQDLMKQGVAGQLQETTKKLYSYGSKEPLESMGKFQACTKAVDREVKVEFVVVNGHDRGLLGRITSQQLGVLKLGPDAVNAVSAGSDDIIREFPECFSGLSKLTNNEVKIHIDQSVKPVAQSTRRILFSLREKLEEKLNKLLKKDVTEPIEGPTQWVSPIDVVPKLSGEIRLCVDMRRANEAVVRERHTIPTIDEVFQTMNGSTMFSKFTLKWGFHQIQLAEESKKITTFSTHRCLYRYKRLMFGISDAFEIYQHVIHEALAGCEGAENISDDIIVYGKGVANHDRKRKGVLCHLRERHLTKSYPCMELGHLRQRSRRCQKRGSLTMHQK